MQTESQGQLNYLSAINETLTRQLEASKDLNKVIVKERDSDISILRNHIASHNSKIEELAMSLTHYKEKYNRTAKEYMFIKVGALKLSEMAINENTKHNLKIKQLEDTIIKMNTQLEIKQSILETAISHRDELIKQQQEIERG